jgi:hypothetical protein
MKMIAPRLLLLVLALLLLGAAVTGRLDRFTDAGAPALSRDAAVATLERVQLRAVAAYAVARALGGVIAVAASTTAEGGIGIAGMSIDIGRALQPAMQLVDVFSDVMIVSLVSLTAQIILIEMMNAYALSAVLPVGLGLLAVAAVLPAGLGRAWRRLAALFVFLALAARFALPLALSASSALSERFLRAHEQAAEQSVALVRGSLPDAAGSLAHPAEIVSRIDQAVQGILTWMTVFLMEAVVLPVGLALCAVLIGRAIVVRGVLGALWMRPR